jgi:hypothetical protein
MASQCRDAIVGISMYQQGCRTRVRVPAYVRPRYRVKLYSTVTTSQGNMGLDLILGSFHTKHIEISPLRMWGSAKAGGSYTRVYSYVLTIEPSHILLLIHKHANYGITMS